MLVKKKKKRPATCDFSGLTGLERLTGPAGLIRNAVPLTSATLGHEADSCIDIL